MRFGSEMILTAAQAALLAGPDEPLRQKLRNAPHLNVEKPRYGRNGGLVQENNPAGSKLAKRKRAGKKLFRM